ncbi:glycosyltransferase family 32 protein [Aspergillus brunneoviolaceus CBS 621.78]|uniref:Glycosyl transferase n=1 Tax=Aspergillus brunneoviolaceus CBS 621.78 TaxID=1450534 RepID=A0ACD1G2I2_9EURO|nr:putative glycosyl transferase [Aspergillus brunneoviolaceus CBS 621.78]RAH43455.1 putative glycosyl transferase [Aspergillus brunneoviolaceus CBS 621.78]
MACLRVRLLFVAVAVITLAGLFLPMHELYLLLRLPFVWKTSAAESILSTQRDGFDVTFTSYANSSGPPENARIPNRLHHVHLGPSAPRAEWLSARAQCLDHHPDWEVFLWEDENAREFVKSQYPDLLAMWEGYPALVQRVDALRYMVLHTYGGAILDMDLACRQSLDPLREFEFVAPAAHPVGISVGMMLAAPNDAYVRALVDNLPRFNRRWALLPYITIMFSTGCHYASTIFTLQSNRSALRVLAGTPDHPTLHMLNGYVNTPLFQHLGTSSWHGRDARWIKFFAHCDQRLSFLVIVVFLLSFVGAVCFCVARGRRAARRPDPTRTEAAKSEGKMV